HPANLRASIRHILPTLRRVKYPAESLLHPLSLFPYPSPMRPETELLGTVKRIVYASDDGSFMVVRFPVDGENDLVTLAGALPGVTAGERLRVSGQWKSHRQHGETF